MSFELGQKLACGRICCKIYIADPRLVTFKISDVPVRDRLVSLVIYILTPATWFVTWLELRAAKPGLGTLQFAACC